jgi:hypothetical protein
MSGAYSSRPASIVFYRNKQKSPTRRPPTSRAD